MREIRPNIYYEDCYAGVTLGALILPRGIVLIDAPLRAEDCLAWNTAVLSQSNKDSEPGSKEMVTDHMLDYLDAHPDRTIGARVLETTGQIPFIIAHRDTARGFESRPTIFKGQNPDSGAEWETCDDIVSTRWALPDLTFSDSLNLYWERGANGKRNNASPLPTWQVILEHHAGSAAGATWVHIPQEKVIFVGDAVLVNQPPFLESAHIPQWLRSLEQLIARAKDGYTIISGRGGLVMEQEIRALSIYLERVHQILAGLAKKGAELKDVEQIVPEFLQRLEYPAGRKSLYEQRLRHGLHHYFMRHYRQIGEIE